jgi:hypothetical protein
VNVTVKAGPATISGNTVALTGAGTVTLSANQSGNVNYSAAAEVTTSFVVDKAVQRVGAWNTIAAKTYGVAPFAVTAPVASSGLPVVLSVKSGPATLFAGTLSVTG